MRALILPRVGVEITELESGNGLLAGKRCDQRLFEHLLALVSARVARGKGGLRRVRFPMIEMIEHRRIDPIEVSDSADMQAQSLRIPCRYARGRNVARDLEVTYGSAEVLGLTFLGQRHDFQL